MHEQKKVYSLRKLSVGLASVVVGTCFFINTNRQNVKADTVNVGERQVSTVIQQDSSEKQEQDLNEQNDQTNVSNSKTEQQQSTKERNDVENVDSNLNDTNKLDNATKPVESEANQKFDQVKNKFKQDTSIDADVPSSVTKNIKKIQTNTLKVVKEFTVNPNSLSLKESKAVDLNTNGGFDSSWGTLDVTYWKGSVQGDYYQLINYTGDANHVIVPNEADFEKAGISTGGKQVAVTNDFFKNSKYYLNTSAMSIRSLAFSKTAGKQVKAIGNNWTDTFSGYGFSKFNGENLDVSEVTNMHNMFGNCNNLSDISPLANWDTSKVTVMDHMFSNCSNLSDISPLAHWDISNVTSMWYMFGKCNNLSDISPLANWDTSNVTSMGAMFNHCTNLSDFTPLANWDTSKVINMASMFEDTALKKITLTNWDFSNIDPSYASIFPDTNFEATLSDKTSKSLLDISSKLSDSVKDILKVIDSAPIVDGVPDVEGRIQDGLDSIKQIKDEYQQQLAKYKQQIDHYKKELADPNADDTTKENNQHELKQAEQKYQYYLTGDGKKSFDEQIQDSQGELEQYKQYMQQEINRVKLQAEYPLNTVFGNHSKITTPNRDLLIYLVGKLPVKSDVATRIIEITFPNGTKKTINQSVGYGKHAISGTADMATHKLDMAMPYELSKWELIKKEDGSYDLVKAHVDKNGVASFDNVALPKVAGYKAVVTPAKQNAINPMAQMFMVSFVALPKQPNTEQPSASSSSVTDKANNSHDLHDDSKKQNDQSITSNKKNDHTINVSAQAVDPTVEPNEHNVASQNNSTTSALTQQSSTNDAEQLENNYSDRVVNDQTDDDNFSNPVREQNEPNKGSNSLSNRSKPDSGKIIHVDNQTPQNGLNEPSKAQSVATHPATSVIKPSKSVSNNSQLPQTGENDGYQYTALSLLLGLNVAMVAVGAEKKRKKY